MLYLGVQNEGSKVRKGTRVRRQWMVLCLLSTWQGPASLLQGMEGL